jgi:hypothetical protein
VGAGEKPYPSFPPYISVLLVLSLGTTMPFIDRAGKKQTGQIVRLPQMVNISVVPIHKYISHHTHVQFVYLFLFFE